MPDSLATLEVKLDASGAASSTDLLAGRLANLDKQNQMVTASTAKLTAGQKIVQDQIIQAAIGVSNLDVTNLKHIELVQKMIANEVSRATALGATSEQMAMLEGIQASYDAQLGIEAAAHDRAAAAAAGHGMQLGRLRQDLGTVIGRLTGTSTVLDRFGGALGAMAIGSGPVIAVMAGIAGIAYAYDKLSLSLRGVTEEQSKAIEEFEKAEKLRAAGGKTGVTNSGLQNNVSADQDEIDTLRKQIGAGASPSTDAQFAAEAGRQQALDKKKARLNELLKLQQDANKAEIAERDKHHAEITQRDAQELADLIKDHNAKASEITRARAMIAQARSDLDQRRAQPSTSENRQMMLDDAKVINELSSAFTAAEKPADQAAASLAKFTEEVKRMGDAAESTGGKDATIDKQLEAFNNQIDIAEKKFPQNRTALEALRASYAGFAEDLKTADYGKVSDEITSQHDAQLALTAATIAGGGAIQDATAAARADAEIKRQQISLGAPLSQALQDEIRDTERLKEIQKDAAGTNSIKDNVDALKIQLAAMEQSNEARGAYVINKEEDLKVTKALGIEDAAQQSARLAEIADEREVRLAIEAVTQAKKDNAKAAKDGMKEEQDIMKTFGQGLRQDFTQAFQDIFKGGKGEFDSLWSAIKTGYARLLAQMAEMKVAKPLMQSLGLDSLGSNGGAYAGQTAADGSPLAAGAGAQVIGGTSMLTVAAIGIAVAGIMAIGASITSVAAENSRAAADFADSTITWKSSFNDLIASFGQTNFDAQKSALDKQFQGLADSAIQAVQKELASDSATWNLGTGNLGNRTSKPGVAALSSMGDLEAYIAQLQGMQGTGHDVQQDRDMATLLDQLQQLDAEYQKQTIATAALQAAQEGLFTQDLRVRQLTAESDTADAAALQRQLDEDAQVKAAQDAGYDAATIAMLKQVQSEEDLKTAADAAAAAQKAQADATAASAKAIADAQASAAQAMATMATRLNDFTIAMGDSVTSLGVRLLKAQGDAAGADALAFKLQQQQEMRAAQAQAFSIQQEIIADQAQMAKNAADQSVLRYLRGDNTVDIPANDALLAAIAALNTMAQGQADYIAQLAVVQAAEAAAAAAAAASGNPSVMPGASAPGAAGSFNTIVSTATAHQADQMVENLSSILTVVATFLPMIAANTGDLGGKMNAYLGRAGQRQLAHAGAGGVS